MVLYIVLGVTFAIIVICRCVWLNNGIAQSCPPPPPPPMHNHVYGRLLNSYADTGGQRGGGGGGGELGLQPEHISLWCLCPSNPPLI